MKIIGESSRVCKGASYCLKNYDLACIRLAPGR